jgi:hypothetical protein
MVEQLAAKYIKVNSPLYDIAIQFKMSLQSLIDRPKELLELIDGCLKPKMVEKKKFGEVFTPLAFINDKMLADLEVHYNASHAVPLYEDESLTWADTTAGMGNFPVAIYYKLMEGLAAKFPVETDRKKHILEKMLFMAEYNAKNCFVITQIFNIHGEYKLNLYQGDSLAIDIEETFGVPRFDIVIGNPPYNEELKSTGAAALYNKFIEKYIDKCDLLCFVIPSRWFSGGKGLDKFRKDMLARTDITYIKHFDDASKIFGNGVDIKGGVHYFLKDSDYSGECVYNGYKTRLDKYDVFVDGQYHAIIDKLTKFASITDVYKSQDYHHIQTNDARLKVELSEGYAKCYVSKQKGFIKYIAESELTTERGLWKAITARASHGHKSGFGNTFIGTPGEVHCKTYISFEFKTKCEADSMVSYMKCRLPNFALSLRKNSQDISKSTCTWIPIPPLDREWNDDLVYEHFELSEEDIELVKTTHIVGYAA